MINSIYHVKHNVRNSLDKLKHFQLVQPVTTPMVISFHFNFFIHGNPLNNLHTALQGAITASQGARLWSLCV